METVWGDQCGFAAFAVGERGYFRGERYEFAGGFHPVFERWPGDVRDYAEQLVEVSQEADVYAAPLLRSSARRRKGTGIPGHYAWVDLDDPPDESASLVQRLLHGSGSFAVGSGRNRHLYIKLHDQLEVSQLEVLNHRLVLTLGGDSKWDETAVLRPPGTLNHKGRARGGDSHPVRIMLP